jgi:VWA domain-containing protein
MSGSRWGSSAALVFVVIAMSASAAPGLDLLLILDRSGSMSRRSQHQEALLRMIVELLARDGETSRTAHRLGVIGFGSTPDVELPFTFLGPDNADLQGRVAALHYVNRGDTDVLAAFVLAEKLFRALPSNSERRRGIILLTDGIAFVRGIDDEAYRTRLREFAVEHFAGGHITLDALLLDPRFRASWSTFARVSVTGSAPDKLLPQAHVVTARLTGTRTAESTAERLVVPPYLEMIVFDVFRAERTASVEIFAPGSPTPIRAGMNGILSLAVGDVMATVVVPHPPPGEWRVRKSRPDARVRVLSQQFFPRGRLLHPREIDTVRRCARVSVVYRLLNASGEPLQELSGYALALDLTLVKPIGPARTLAMEREQTLGTAAFRSANDPVCDVTGRYWTDVRVTAVDSSGHRLEVFRDRWSGFSVSPAECAPSSIGKKTTP